mgnify:CR=1 FL=1
MALVNERACILANEEVGPNLYLMELAASHIAASIEPGQFVHMKVPSMEAHILRRPFSVYARDAAAGHARGALPIGGLRHRPYDAHRARASRAPLRRELIGPVGRGVAASRERASRPSSWAAAWVLRRFSCCARV